MLFKYRNGERRVRPKIYKVIKKFKFTQHMSQVQAEDTIVEIANRISNNYFKF